MKIRLLCRKETVEKVKAAIQKWDVQFDDHASMVLYEINHEYDYLLVKDGEEHMRLAVDEILYIESISQEKASKTLRLSDAHYAPYAIKHCDRLLLHLTNAIHYPV